jgi:hypothetical protein
MFKLAMLAPIVFLGFSSAVVADAVRSNADKVQSEQVSSSTKGKKKSSKDKSGSGAGKSGNDDSSLGQAGVLMDNCCP